MPSDSRQVGPLGDSPRRSYAATLDLFQRFAARELRETVAGLGLRAGDAVLDAGCGTGVVTALLAEQVTPGGHAVGVDISSGHLGHARDGIRRSGLPVTLVQGDLSALPFAARRFDLIWCSNTINHVREPLETVKAFAELLVPGGRLALGQSAFLPDMFFAWDARLEREVTRACYQFYRDKYGLDERDTAAVRNLFGLLKRGGLKNVTARTVLIERTAPLAPEDETYFLEGVFRAHWGEQVRPYLSREDWLALERLCDPDSPDFCPRRPDFHHLQTYTVVIGSA
jgi:ubiquinone/menaquinone biosynthesis C-methylase UbiE